MNNWDCGSRPRNIVIYWTEKNRHDTIGIAKNRRDVTYEMGR